MTILLVDFQDVFKSALRKTLKDLELKLDVISAASIRHANEIIAKSKASLTIVECSKGNMFDTFPILQKLHESGKEFYVISDCKNDELHNAYTQCNPNAIFCTPLNTTSLIYQIERKFIKSKESNFNSSYNSSHFVFKWNSLIQKERYEDIIYISGLGNYITIHVGDKNIKARYSLVTTANSLPKEFIRVHRNYIINLAYAAGINIADNVVLVQDNRIPIGRRYKKELVRRFTEFFKKS